MGAGGGRHREMVAGSQHPKHGGRSAATAARRARGTPRWRLVVGGGATTPEEGEKGRSRGLLLHRWAVDHD